MSPASAIRFKKCLGSAGSRSPARSEGTGIPPSPLDTGDRDTRPAPAPDQHRAARQPVLLAASDFLAVQEQDGLVAAVVDQQFGDRALLGRLLDGQCPTAIASWERR